MTLIDKACFERGCACYYSRDKGECVEVVEKREWVGLTMEDKQEFVNQDFGGNRLDAMDWAEQRLKEKNT
jgi:hypothetical protein